MIVELVLWLAFGFFSLGVMGSSYIVRRKTSSRPWRLKVDKEFSPKISIIIPTYNESSVINLKLRNLSILDYPKNLCQLIFVDSNSQDGTLQSVNNFARANPNMRIQVLEESERKGKSAALNEALKHCEGDVVVISDADCFWPSDILREALPFLADPDVGAISGPKILLNRESSRVARGENGYLNSMNVIKLGESKTGSTLLFEGGFSAYRKEILDSFDPYHTGSDDCGTVISVLEKGSRAIMIPEGRFYTTFPNKWREKIGMKVRRANQLIRLFWKYLALLTNRRIKNNNRTIIVNILIYLLGPIFFFLFLSFTIIIFIIQPLLIASLLLFFIPRVGTMLVEVFQGFSILFIGLLSVVSRRDFSIWNKSSDRNLFTEDELKRYDLL